MKILNELLIIAAAAVFGYIAYKVFTTVTAAGSAVAGAAGSVGATALSWTPASIAQSVAQDAGNAVGAVTGLFSGDNSDTTQGALQNQLLPATSEANDGYNDLIESEMNPYPEPAGVNFTNDYIPTFQP